MKSIIISPFSSVQPNGALNAKNYPFWGELIELLKQNEFYTIQINPGYEPSLKTDILKSGLNLDQLKDLLLETDIWISVDNFFQHFAHFYKKYGCVIWGKSDPLIFGYKENINILKDRKYLRNNQFLWWKDELFDENVFVKPKEIMDIISNWKVNGISSS